MGGEIKKQKNSSYNKNYDIPGSLETTQDSLV